MNNPLVSVAIITFNQEDFIIEAIESVLIQDYKNIEIIIADDASTDNTPEIIKNYQLKYPEIIKPVLAPRNLGITGNSNAAFFACEGKYIAWLGGDDVFLPGKLSKQISFMESESQCAICYHDLEIFESTSNEILGYLNVKHEGDIKTMIRYGCFNGGCSTMVRRECCPDDGFNQFIPVASDWLHWIDCLKHGGTIKHVPGVLARYRRHASNVTSKKNEVVNRILVDKLNTISILLLKYPQHSPQILTVLAETMRGQARKNPENYFRYLIVSINIKPTVKTVLLLVTGLLSFGKYKKLR